MYEMMELISLKRKKNIFIFLFLALIVVFCVTISMIAKSSIHDVVQVVLMIAVALITILLEFFITYILSKYFRRITLLRLPMVYRPVALSSISDIPDYVPKYHIATVYARRGFYKDVDIKFIYTDETKDHHLSLSMEEAEKFIVF
ncbi:MAG: hypothetical protein HFJ58_04445 [Clostridia bacterium]|nr:hypothetical protein [Clostridia bacterium]